MTTASITELRRELRELPAPELVEICLRMARFKKENKELLSYLVFEKQDETGYVNSCKQQIEEEFEIINKDIYYYAKKGVRRVLRFTKSRIKYSADKTTEIELLLHFCKQLSNSQLHTKSSTMANLFEAQIKRIRTVIAQLHEDLQYDYKIKLAEVLYIILP
ncbi:hypothetical protein GC194_07585 [bacterium]|nr:hypothetical protein [bacterium]